MMKQPRTEPKTPDNAKYSILREDEPGTSAKANLKNVIETQYKELQKVACYFELKLFKTAYELIQPPYADYCPTVKKNAPAIKNIENFDKCILSYSF